MNDAIYLTKDGFSKLSKEQKYLNEKRKSAVASISRAREMGDLSENAFYKSARQDLSSIDRRLRELSYILRNYQLISKSKSSLVSIGNAVKVRTNKKEVTYQIVGGYEADPKNGKISNESPLGKMLLDKKKGEEFKVNEISYEIIEIS